MTESIDPVVSKTNMTSALGNCSSPEHSTLITDFSRPNNCMIVIGTSAVAVLLSGVKLPFTFLAPQASLLKFALNICSAAALAFWSVSSVQLPSTTFNPANTPASQADWSRDLTA